MLEIIKRVSKPTPKLFKKIRNIGIILASISGAILTSPVALPVGIVTLAGYLAVGGGIAAAVSQVTTENE